MHISDALEGDRLNITTVGLDGAFALTVERADHSGGLSLVTGRFDDGVVGIAWYAAAQGYPCLLRTGWRASLRIEGVALVVPADDLEDEDDIQAA